MNAVCEDVLATAAGNELTLVHLHGLTETDDRLALREIARQMKLDNVVRDKGRYVNDVRKKLGFYNP